MTEAQRTHGRLILERCREALERNRFEAHVVPDREAARRLVMDQILPSTGAKTLSFGGSGTLEAAGLLDEIKRSPGLELLDIWETPGGREAVMEAGRRALTVDCFLSGSNAVTLEGQLVNLDMWGNRAGALAYGPRSVVVLAGRNKVVAGLANAMVRVRNVAAPLNAIRINTASQRPIPCSKTAECINCSSEWRICNTWVIHEKSFPAGRIKVVLINEDLGL